MRRATPAQIDAAMRHLGNALAALPARDAPAPLVAAARKSWSHLRAIAGHHPRVAPLLAQAAALLRAHEGGAPPPLPPGHPLAESIEGLRLAGEHMTRAEGLPFGAARRPDIAAAQRAVDAAIAALPDHPDAPPLRAQLEQMRDILPTFEDANRMGGAA